MPKPNRTMRIFAWSGDSSGCGYYRLRLPYAELEKHGHSTRVLTQKPGALHLKNDFQLDNQPADVIVGQRIVLPEFIPIWRRLRVWAPLVQELDDDLFHVDRRNQQAAVLYSREGVRETLRHCSWIADLVTVSTAPLKQVMIEECDLDPDKIVVIENRVDASLFEMERTRRDRVVIGWAGGGSHDQDFEEIHRPLRRILDRTPNVEFHCVGHDFRSLIRRPNVRFTMWKDNMDEYLRGIDFDIGLVPLAHTTFNKSKSALKILEYSALGIPAVASDEPPYRDAIIDGETGFLVDSSWKWEKRIRELIADEELRTQMGKAAREHVRRRWSIADGWQDWERAYARIARGAA